MPSKRNTLSEAIAKSWDHRWLVLGVAGSALAVAAVPGLALAAGGKTCGISGTEMACSYDEDINANGEPGIKAEYKTSGTHSITVTTTGSITTQGNNAPGISAKRTEDIIVLGWPIGTKPADGDITIRAEDINTTTGSKSYGIDASNASGKIDIIAGDIHSASTGVQTNSSATGNTFIQVGKVVTQSGPGIDASNNNGDIHIESGAIDSQGTGVRARIGSILNLLPNGNIAVQTGDITSRDGDGIETKTVIGTTTIKSGDIQAEKGMGINATGVSSVNVDLFDLLSNVGPALSSSAITIETGNVLSQNTGIRAQVDAVSGIIPGLGGVDVQANNVTSTQGDGIYAKTGFGTVGIRAGNVTAQKEGVHAESGFALDVLPDLADLGSLDPAALLAPGVSVDVGDVTATGGSGIYAVIKGVGIGDYGVPGIGNVAVNAGNVSAGSDGITAGTGLGLVTVNAGNVDAGGDGISAETGLGLAAITAGDVSASGLAVKAEVNRDHLGSLSGLSDLLEGAIPELGDLENGVGVAYVNVGDVTSQTGGGIDASAGLGAAVALAGNVHSAGTGIHSQVVGTGLAFALANDVTTTGGSHAKGLDVSAGGLAGAVALGKVSTQGDDSAGVSVTASDMGDLTGIINSVGQLVGTGGGGDLGSLIDQGLDALLSGLGAGSGILPEGTGDTLAGLADGALDAVSGGVAVAIANEVETAGQNSAGIEVSAPDGIAGAVAFGPVSTSGIESTGIQVDGKTFAGVAALGPVTTVEDDSTGIWANADNGSAYVVASSVTTLGDHSAGIINTANGTSTTIFGTVSTAGDYSPAVVADDPGSDVLVAGLLATTVGDYSSGIKATSGVGNVDVYAAAVGTQGSHSTGIRAASDDGSVNVQAGAVGTQGDHSRGISAFSNHGSVNVQAGAVGTTGSHSEGIRAAALEGDVAVNALLVGTAGSDSTGISAFSRDGSVGVQADAVGTVGQDSDGIRATALAGNVNVDAGYVGTVGSNSAGIAALSSDGSVNVRADAVGTVGSDSDGIRAVSQQGDVNVDAGYIGTLGSDSDGIFASTYNGSVNVRANDPVTAVGPNSRGIFAMSAEGDTQVLIESLVLGGSGSDGAGVAFGGGHSALLVNNGLITALNGMAIVNDDNASETQNNGVVIGRVSMGGGNDRFYNNEGGTFVAIGDSDFGAGNQDLFSNAGTLTMDPLRGSPQIVRFDGLETFDNSPGGEIHLMNSIAGDRFHFTDSSLVRGGSFAMDADLRPGGLGDQLYFGGDVYGAEGSQVALVVNDLDGGPGQYDPNGVLFATVAGDTAVGDFTTNGGIDKGLFRYDAYLKPNGGALGENEWYLASTPGRSAYELPVIASAAQDLWHDSMETWRERSSDLRLGQSTTTASGNRAKAGVWMKLFGGNIERRFDNTSGAPGGMLGPDHKYSDKLKRTHQGVMIGLDRDFRAARPDAGQSLYAGVMAGYTESRLRFSEASTRADYDATSVGVYTTWIDGGLFVDGAIKADFGRIKYRGDLGNFNNNFTSVGATVDAGYRYSPAGKWFVEPKATLAYVHTRYDDAKLAGTKLDFGSGNSVRGRLGARVGTQFATANTLIEPWVELSLWHEFKKHPSVALSGDGWDVPVTYDRDGTYGTAALGVDLFGKANGWSGFAKATTTFGGHSLEGVSGTLGIRKTW